LVAWDSTVECWCLAAAAFMYSISDAGVGT
jgi:hypothetical protein